MHLLARKVDCAVVNAGDGAHEHPTQALLDALTIRRNKGRIEGLIVAICGDILHSRVARSNILLLLALGARVRVVGPSTLMPTGIERLGVEVFQRHAQGARRRRHRHDAAPAAGADERRFRPVDERIFPLFTDSIEEKLALRQARRAGHASGPDEPWRRDRLRSSPTARSR